MYYVEQDGKRISKYYKFKLQAIVHCFEHRFVFNGCRDFIGDKGFSNKLQDNIKIKKLGEKK